MCEFRAVLAVEPPALADRKNGTRKSEPATSLVSFLISPLRGFKYYLIGTKKNVNKNDRKMREEIAKYSHENKRKKAVTKPGNPANDSCRICKYFFDVKYGNGESLYSYRRFRRLPLTVPPH